MFYQGQQIKLSQDIEGTGFKKGETGKIIFVQDQDASEGKRSVDRSSDLAKVCYQVRFQGGGEI